MIEFKSNLSEVLGRLDRLAKGGGDLTPLMRIFAGMLLDRTEENFEKQGRPKWADLKPSTIARRKKEGTWPGKILQRRGRLAASIRPGATRTSAWVSTNLAYARIHQFGGTIARAAYGGTVRLRTDARGNLMRQGKGGKLAIFASGRHKRAKGVRFETAGHRVTIPARPYFALTSADQDDMAGVAARFIAGLTK